MVLQRKPSVDRSRGRQVPSRRRRHVVYVIEKTDFIRPPARDDERAVIAGLPYIPADDLAHRNPTAAPAARSENHEQSAGLVVGPQTLKVDTQLFKSAFQYRR